MKNKYVDIIFMGILSCSLISLFFLSPTLVGTIVSKEKEHLDSSLFIETSPVADNVFYTQTIVIKEKYEELISVLYEMKNQGIFTSDDMLKIHKSIGTYESNIPVEVPYTDKDLLEYLYDNNIITKAQFEQIVDLINQGN